MSFCAAARATKYGTEIDHPGEPAMVRRGVTARALSEDEVMSDGNSARLTPDEAIARARALHPLLQAQQVENEARGAYSQELHEAFVKAGFYRLLLPRLFGGHEFSLPDFYRVMVEISRGHPSVGWSVTLPSSHVLFVAAHWPERAQREVFEHADYTLIPWRAAPMGKAARVEGGYRVTGVWNYASGAPHGTHFIGNAAIEGGGSVQCLVPRADFRVLDDWGGDRMLGMQASGSNSVSLENVFVPEHRAVANPGMRVPEEGLAEGTPGTRLHGNPMYLGQIGGPFQASLVAVVVGAARAAIDEYSAVVTTKKQMYDPTTLMADGPDAPRHLGEAITLTDAAEAGMLGSMEQYMDMCRRCVRDGAAISDEANLRLRGSLQRTGQMACDAIEILFLNCGSSAAKRGNRLQQYFRDAQMYRSHGSSLPDEVSARLGRSWLGRRVGWPWET